MLTNPRLRRAWITSAVMFLIHGLVFSQWAARIPAIQAKLNIGAGALGTALMAAAFGSICSIPLCGWLVTRFGSARITLLSGLGFCAALIPLTLATNGTLLAAALFLYGSTAGTMDVAMNVQAVEVERAMGTRVMSRFHAVFSVGGMAGAALGGLAAARGVGPGIHLPVAACVLGVLLALFAPGMIPDHRSGEVTERGHFSLRVPPALLAISAIAFCILASEGAVADWSALFLGRTLKADPGTAALGYSVFSGAMATVRFMGDWISNRMGTARTVRTASLLAAAGMFAVVISPTPDWALPGFAATGAGLAVIAPLAYAAGGRMKGVSPGTGVATVTGLGYAGFLIGPPAIGLTSQNYSLRHGLGLVVVFCLVAAVLARWADNSTSA